MQLKPDKEIDKLIESNVPGVDKDRRAELALHARNCSTDKYEELLRTFDEAGKKAEAKFLRSLFDGEAGDTAGSSANGTSAPAGAAASA